MNVLTGILEALSKVFTTYVPALAKGGYDMFINLFAKTTTAEGGAVTVSGLNELGYVAAGIIGIGIVAGLFSMALHVLRLRGSAKKQRRAF